MGVIWTIWLWNFTVFLRISGLVKAVFLLRMIQQWYDRSREEQRDGLIIRCHWDQSPRQFISTWRNLRTIKPSLQTEIQIHKYKYTPCSPREFISKLRNPRLIGWNNRTCKHSKHWMNPNKHIFLFDFRELMEYHKMCKSFLLKYTILDRPRCGSLISTSEVLLLQNIRTHAYIAYTQLFHRCFCKLFRF